MVEQCLRYTKVYFFKYVSIALYQPQELQNTMATTRKRSFNTGSVPKATIAQATSALKGLPTKPKETLSMRETFEMLHEPITAALAKGYSPEEIITMLANQGIAINLSSLKYYLASIRRQKAAPSAPKTRKPRKTEPDAIAADVAPSPSINVTPSRSTSSGKRGIQSVISYLMDDSDQPVVADSDKAAVKASELSATEQTSAESTPSTSTRSRSNSKTTRKSSTASSSPAKTKTTSRSSSTSNRRKPKS
jgi:hypothetical protein